MANQQTNNTKKIKEMIKAYSEFKSTMKVLRTDQRRIIKNFVETIDKSKADDILNKIKEL